MVMRSYALLLIAALSVLSMCAMENIAHKTTNEIASEHVIVNVTKDKENTERSMDTSQISFDIELLYDVLPLVFAQCPGNSNSLNRTSRLLPLNQQIYDRIIEAFLDWYIQNKADWPKTENEIRELINDHFSITKDIEIPGRIIQAFHKKKELQLIAEEVPLALDGSWLRVVKLYATGIALEAEQINSGNRTLVDFNPRYCLKIKRALMVLRAYFVYLDKFFEKQSSPARNDFQARALVNNQPELSGETLSFADMLSATIASFLTEIDRDNYFKRTENVAHAESLSCGGSCTRKIWAVYTGMRIMTIFCKKGYGLWSQYRVLKSGNYQDKLRVFRDLLKSNMQVLEQAIKNFELVESHYAQDADLLHEALNWKKSKNLMDLYNLAFKFNEQ